MAREDPQLKVRFPTPLKEAIEKAAAAAGRSMNTEIAMRLARTFEGDRTEAELMGLTVRARLAERQAHEAEEKLQHLRINAYEKEAEISPDRDSLLTMIADMRVMREKIERQTAVLFGVAQIALDDTIPPGDVQKRLRRFLGHFASEELEKVEAVGGRWYLPET